MSFSLRIDSSSLVLHIESSGPAGLAELSGLAALVGEVATLGGHKLVLTDLAAVEPRLSFTEHLQFGTRAFQALKGVRRVAAVVPPGYIDAPAARAAQLAGLHLKTFYDPSEAMAWLLKS